MISGMKLVNKVEQKYQIAMEFSLQNIYKDFYNLFANGHCFTVVVLQSTFLSYVLILFYLYVRSGIYLK